MLQQPGIPRVAGGYILVYLLIYIYIYIYIYVRPHQGSGVGIAIKGDAWVSGWYPAAVELVVLKKAYSSHNKKTRY